MARLSVHWKSDDIFSVESTSDMTLKTSAKWTGQATSDAKLSGANVTVSADSAASLEGLNTSVKGTTSLKGQGAQVEIKSDGPANFEGAMVDVKASGMLTCESSAMATFKGAIANLTGSLIKVG